MEPSVRPLDSRELGPASVLLAHAFSDDPFIGHFFAQRRRRELALPRFFRSVLHELSAAGAVFGLEIGGTLHGVAAWVPPEAPSSSRRSRLPTLFASFEVRALFPRAAPRLLAG